MVGIFKWIGSLFKSIGLAIAMPFTKIKSSSRSQAVVRWVFHFACLTGVIAGLAFLSQSMQLDTLLRTPAAWLRTAWLPLLAVQLYLISWVGWWLCRSVLSKHRSGDFPDLQKHWNKMEAKLQQAGLDIARLPVFLVLGQPKGSTNSFFDVGKLKKSISIFTDDSDSPFSVHASDEAVYICCEQNSLIGKQSALLHRVDQRQRGQTQSVHAADDQRPAHDFSTATRESSGNLGNDTSVSYDQPLPSYAAAVATVDEFDTSGSVGLETARKTVPSTKTLPKADATLDLIETNIALLDETTLAPQSLPSFDRQESTYQPASRKTLPILQNELEIESTIARLAYLCELVNQTRRPYCPINGIVVLVPFSTTQSEALANHAGMLIEQDLQAIRDTLMVEAPRIAVICDIQQIDGCSDLLSRFPKQQRHRRLGIKFPLVPPCDRARVSEMIVEGLDWMCLKMIPPLVNRLFLTDNGSNEQVVSDGNRRIYQFAQALRGRQKQLERLIRRAFMCQSGSNGRLRGCYLSATGSEHHLEQGFTAGIFSQVLEMQNDVAWHDQAIQRDKDFRRWSLFGYIAVSTIALTTLICILL